MFNFKNFARQAMLAAALAIGSSAALAGPTYLVTIHTEGVDAEAGLMDFSFYTTNDTSDSVVSMSNFTGAFGEEYDRSGSAAGTIADTVTFVPSNFNNYLTYNVLFGGDFSFNVTFSGDFLTVPGDNASALVVGLFDSMMSTEYGMAVMFDLIPALNTDPAAVLVTVNDPGLATVTEQVSAEVPEPSQLLLMLSALALAGVALRRRNAA